MSFDALAFDTLLTSPEQGSRLQWSQARRCPCLDPEGGVLVTCAVCGGEGWVWDEWSDEFRAGLLGLTGRQMEANAQRWGQGMTGDASLSLSMSSPPYATLTERDRLVALDAMDVFEWTLLAGVLVKLPVQAVLMEARQKSSDGLSLVRVPVPVADVNGRISVTATTAVRLAAPRRYEVLGDLSQVRGWMLGLPRKVALKLVDTSVRW